MGTSEAKRRSAHDESARPASAGRRTVKSDRDLLRALETSSSLDGGGRFGFGAGPATGQDKRGIYSGFTAELPLPDGTSPIE